ncbi:unnamed protein product, partial [Plutella xylostella]
PTTTRHPPKVVSPAGRRASRAAFACSWSPLKNSRID